MKFIKSGILLLGFCITIGAHAIAPVVDAYDDDDDDNTSSAKSYTKHDVPKPAIKQEATKLPPRQDMINTGDSASNNKTSFSIGQRLSIQEQQITNLNPLLVKVDDLTQKMCVLQGMIEEQQHQFKLLQELVRNQYQDLDKRLTSRSTPIFGSKPAVKPNPSLSDPTMVAKTTVASGSVVPTALGERAYQAAFQLLKNKQYPLAIQGFEDFVKKYPSDINLPNANYFLGQLYLLQGQAEQSIGRFTHFITVYPRDARVPDALLQLGLAYFAKGEKSTAMDIFKKIIQRYPDSKAAQAAQARLQQFQAMISAANASIVAKSKV